MSRSAGAWAQGRDGGCWETLQRDRADLFAGASSPAPRTPSAPQQHQPSSSSSSSSSSWRPHGPAQAPPGGPAGRQPLRARAHGVPSGPASASVVGPSAHPPPCGDDGDGRVCAEEDADYIKAQIRCGKQETLQSSRNALRVVVQTEERAAATMSQLGAQSQMLSRIEDRMEVSQLQAETAAEKAAHLKSLNRSMFLPHFRAPWSKKKRAAERIAKVEADHLAAQQRKENLRAQEREAHSRVQETVRGAGGMVGLASAGGGDSASPRDYSRYQFEADEEDHAIEREIDSNFDGISDAVSRLKNLALGMNSEIDRQNQSIGRIAGKVDLTGATIAGSSARLKSVK